MPFKTFSSSCICVNVDYCNFTHCCPICFLRRAYIIAISMLAHHITDDTFFSLSPPFSLRNTSCFFSSLQLGLGYPRFACVTFHIRRNTLACQFPLLHMLHSYFHTCLALRDTLDIFFPYRRVCFFGCNNNIFIGGYSCGVLQIVRNLNVVGHCK